MAIIQQYDLGEFIRHCQEAGLLTTTIDNSAFFKKAKYIIVEELRRGFETGTAPDGSSWAPLKHARPNGRSHPLWDTGALVRSIGAGQGHVEQMTGDTFILGTNLKYAHIHQYGGTIRGQGKKLSIPLTMEAKRAGGARNFPRPLFYLPSKKPNTGLLAERKMKGKGKKKTPTLVIHYALKDSVTIPARPFIGFSQQLADRLEDLYAQIVFDRMP